MISVALKRNTVFTSTTLVENSVLSNSTTTQSQVIVNNNIFNNIVNNYNIISCDGGEGCSACGSEKGSVVSEPMRLNYDLWDSFTDVINQINDLLTDFSLGNFEKITGKLTWDFYNRMSKMIFCGEFVFMF